MWLAQGDRPCYATCVQDMSEGFFYGVMYQSWTASQTQCVYRGEYTAHSLSGVLVAPTVDQELSKNRVKRGRNLILLYRGPGLHQLTRPKSRRNLLVCVVRSALQFEVVSYRSLRRNALAWPCLNNIRLQSHWLFHFRSHVWNTRRLGQNSG